MSAFQKRPATKLVPVPSTNKIPERDVDKREHEAMINDFIKNMGNEK